MGRLTQAHAPEFERIRALCYQGLDSVALREQVGDRLSRHLGLASYCFGVTDPATALPVHSVSVGLHPEAMRAFLGLVLETPSLDFGPWVECGRRVARLDDLVDDLDRDPYVEQVLQPSNLAHEVQVACWGEGWSWGHACLRRAGGRPFQGHELRFLDAVAPHLTAGLRAAAARAAHGASPGTEVGIVVLDGDGCVELANGVAERLFSRPADGTRHSFLSAVNIVALRLERLLGAPADVAAAVDAEAPSLVVLDEATRATYRLRAERLTGHDGRQRGLVTIEPATFPSPTGQMVLLAHLGLTRRECDVATALVRGRSTAEIAAELIVSPHTVADHVRSIYEKVGVTSRQGLAMRLLGAV